MTKVVVPNGDVDTALKKLKIKVAKSGVPSEVKKRKHYKKPGVERRERKEEMKKRGVGSPDIADSITLALYEPKTWLY